MKTLTVIPLATPQTVPQNSLEAVKSVDRLYLQTTEHICANAALRIRPEAVSMDDLYSECFDFDELNERIAERLAAAFESENAENLNVGYAMSLVLMIIVLLCMSFTSSFDEDEMEGVS